MRKPVEATPVALSETTNQERSYNLKVKRVDADTNVNPQTFDPGIGVYVGLGVVSSALMVELEKKERNRK